MRKSASKAFLSPAQHQEARCTYSTSQTARIGLHLYLFQLLLEVRCLDRANLARGDGPHLYPTQCALYGKHFGAMPTQLQCDSQGISSLIGYPLLSFDATVFNLSSCFSVL